MYQPRLDVLQRLERALELAHPAQLHRLLARGGDVVLVLELRLEVAAPRRAVRPATAEGRPESRRP